MKIRIISDLHIDAAKFNLIHNNEEDIWVIAGDISNNMEKSIFWIRNHIPYTPVIFVPGNHEYYCQKNIPELHQRAKELTAGTNIKCCPHGVYIHAQDDKKYAFLGHSYWTDFDLYGSPDVSKIYWKQGLNDSRYIYRKNMRITADDFVTMNKAGIRFIRNQIKQLDGTVDKIILVSHYFDKDSIHSQYQGDPYNPGFASNLPRDILDKIDVMIHGHTHKTMSYINSKHNVQVICNPRGYVSYSGNTENANFDEMLLVEI